MELNSNLILPENESVTYKWLLDNRDAVVSELKDYYEGTLDICGPDDDINTIPAKELYEKACDNIFSCKDEIVTFFYEKQYWDKYIADGINAKKLNYKSSNIKDARVKAFANAYLGLLLKHDGYIPYEDKDELKKFIFLVVNYVSRDRLISEIKNSEEETIFREFYLMSEFMDAIGSLTPIELTQIFPIDKTYDGKKFQCKDYFYSMDVIKKHGPDKVIGKGNAFNFLWDYENMRVRLFLVEYMSAMSNLYKLQSGKGIMEEFLEENGVDTYSYDSVDGYLINNRTGQITKTYKPKKRVPKQFKRVK